MEHVNLDKKEITYTLSQTTLDVVRINDVQYYSLEQIKSAIKDAFKSGENWGVCYSTWFIPTQEQHDKELKLTTDSIINTLTKP